MSRNLLKGGHRVRGFDLSPNAGSRHAVNGGIRSGSVADAADGADFLITMLPNGDIVRDVVLGPSDVLEIV